MTVGRKQNLVRAARAMDSGGVPRRQIAERLGITRSYLYRIMRGKWALKQVHQARNRRASKRANLLHSSDAPGSDHVAAGSISGLSEDEQRTITVTIGALARAVLRFGRHDSNCAALAWYQGACDCGYAKASQLSKAVTEGENGN